MSGSQRRGRTGEAFGFSTRATGGPLMRRIRARCTSRLRRLAARRSLKQRRLRRSKKCARRFPSPMRFGFRATGIGMALGMSGWQVAGRRDRRATLGKTIAGSIAATESGSISMGTGIPMTTTIESYREPHHRRIRSFDRSAKNPQETRGLARRHVGAFYSSGLLGLASSPVVSARAGAGLFPSWDKRSLSDCPAASTSASPLSISAGLGGIELAASP